MCDPITLLIGSAVLGGGSYFANQKAQERVEKAQNAVRAAEWERQDDLQREAQSIFDQTLAKSGADNQKDELAQLQAEKAQEASDNVVRFSDRDYLPGTAKSNTVIRRDTKNQIQQGDTERDRRAQLAAILDAYGGVQTDRNITQQISGQDLGRTASFAKGSSNVAQQEIAAKANDTGFWGVLAPILGAAASAAGTAGSAGLFAPAAATVTPSSEALLAANAGSAPGFSASLLSAGI